MKKSLILISIILINLVSAYNNFSLDNALQNIDETTFILGALFVLIFGLTNLILKKRFTGENEQMTAGIIALAFSSLAVYWIYKKDFGIADFFEGLFSPIGISSDILYLILPLIILVGIIYIIYKMKSWGLLIIGILLLILALMSGNLILGIIGLICLITGIILIKKGEGGKLFGKLILLLIVFCFGYFAPFYTGIVVILYLIFRLLKKRDNRETGIGSILMKNPSQGTSTPTQQPQRINRQTLTQNEINSLRWRYSENIKKMDTICKNVGNHIPKKGTLEYKSWKTLYKRNESIKKLAKRFNFRL